MPAAPRILVFDSGVGGLSIISEIQRHLPHCSLIYASDNAAFPYGTKTEEELVERVDKVLHRLIDHCRADIVVVACNTASTIALPHIRSRFRQPVVGVVPAIKPAAQASATKVIGLLATPGTISRPYTHQLIRDFATHCRVISVGSSTLVEQAERKLRNLPPEPQVLQSVLAELFEAPGGSEIDCTVLACTHFPLLREELGALAPRPMLWIDSGEAIARRTVYWADQLQLPTGASGAPVQHQSLFTADTPALRQLLPNLAKFHGGSIDIVSI